MRRQTHIDSSKGFTLVELLVVIVIIAILAALSVSGIASAMRFAAKTKAKTEVKSLAAALNSYYGEYRRWPNMGGSFDPMEMENGKIEIADDWARLLTGDNVNDQNPKRICFMTFEAMVGDTPVNPWFTGDSIGDVDDGDKYYAKFDMNYDNKINGTGSSDPFEEPEGELKRNVVVWTVHMDMSTGEVDTKVRSWE